MDSFNIQTFVQWLITGGVSLITIVVSLRQTTKKLETDIETINETIKSGFYDINKKIENIRLKVEDDAKLLAVLNFRIESVEKQLDRLES